jgi:hypothetical protein
MSMLPVDEFPLGSKSRLIKANVSAERTFRLFVYIATTLTSFACLKSGDFLDVKLLGDQ